MHQVRLCDVRLQDRKYVSKEGRTLHAESLGRVLTAFLQAYFPDVVDYGFTSALEAQLDDVSGGRADWTSVCSEFWRPLSSAAQSTAAISVRDVIDVLDGMLEPQLFPPQVCAASNTVKLIAQVCIRGRHSRSQQPPNADNPCHVILSPPHVKASALRVESISSADTAIMLTALQADGADPRKCPACGGRLGLKPAHTGGFIGCSNYPTCRHARPLGVTSDASDALTPDSDGATRTPAQTQQVPACCRLSGGGTSHMASALSHAWLLCKSCRCRHLSPCVMQRQGQR